MRILISAGEASGEMYGAQLIEALRLEFSATGHGGTGALARPAEQSSAKAEADPLEFFGVGGDKMRAAGCDTVVDAKDLAVVGISEILGQLPKIWKLFHHLIDEAGRRKPDLAIVIDSPGFNWRVAREMKKRGVPVVYYVCPQFWAWRQGRVKLLRDYVDKALVIFPFEEKFYRDRGVNAEFVGHPLADLARPEITREQYASQFHLDPEKQWITLMPGSRRKEVRMNLPGILSAAQQLGKDYEFLIPLAPTLDKKFLESLVQQEQQRESTTSSRALSNSSSAAFHIVPDALPALAHSRAGIIASGTATVEAALMGLPFVMVYRVTTLTYLLGRSTVKVPYFAMVNLIAGEQVVPELVQSDFTPKRVVSELNNILPEGPPRQEMLRRLQLVRSRLKASAGAPNAPSRAATAIRALLARKYPRQA